MRLSKRFTYKTVDLYLHNYKEPFKLSNEVYKNTYGYMGTLATTFDHELIQCHECGELYEHLGAHVYQKHGMKADKYREKFELAIKTPLASDTRRAKMIKSYNANGREYLHTMWKKNWSDRSKFKYKRRRLEVDNEVGTCPDQTVDRIKTLATKLGHAPTSRDYLKEYRFGYRAIFRHFGTWEKAVQMAGLVPKNKDDSVDRSFFRYSKDQLIQLLKVFYEREGRTPTSSDFDKRGDLPKFSTYRRYFGSINSARQAAGIPTIIHVGSKWVEVISNTE